VTQPSKPIVPPGPLTFEELRLANLMHPHNPASPLSLRNGFSMLEKLDDETLAQALAEIVIHADWMAANKGIDLVLAIRNRFALGEDLIHDLERKRASFRV
jgi:hypothetical protein